MRLKKSFCTFFCCIVFQQVFSQTDSLPVFKRFPELPLFTIMTVPDSVPFTREALNRKKRTIFIVFSPDCGHCQQYTRQLLDSIGLIRKTQIVMISSMDFTHIKNFYEAYKIKSFSMITMGRDGGYHLPTFFSTRQFPSVYVYDKRGVFVQHFEGGGSIREIAGLK